MTQIIPFKPNGKVPFSFQVTVSGVQLFGTVPWNMYANRYYLKLTDSTGATVVYVPMIASAEFYDINLALPYAPGALIYRESSRQFEAT
ncbi:hypothetical protein [Buttiauxella sp. S19-1]|uniref:hypothetical protein n=1 Tax=Buttiauxella sp. S19-1 TaxID=941430 RepID=UPI001EDA0384|nr:hypothetical protein [Buttiauxella sp. S19-1]